MPRMIPLLTSKINEDTPELPVFIVDCASKLRVLRSGSKLVLVASTNWSGGPLIGNDVASRRQSPRNQA